ncbi:MAG: ATP-binding protein, partial [Bacteroidales bacterium]|nr:ATP-binding protein [Bacteroidales bacterium]
YLLGLSPVQNIDPTPFAFTFTGLFMSISVLRYRLLDLMPIARRHVFRSMTDGLVVVDVQNRIVDVNPEGVRIFNWDRMPYGELADELWKDYPQLTALLKDQNAETIELEIANQQVFHYYLVSSSVIKESKKRMVGVLLVIHDITFRHQMQEAIIQNEEKLRVLNAEKDKLFSVIAHDLRGPMGAFTALTELILQQPGDISADEMRHLMHSMNKSARSLQDLLENLLYWSRMQRDDVRIELKSLPPERFVREVLSLFQESVRSKELKVTTSLKPVMVIADEQMLLFVLRNLISNAIKFTHQGGVIHIKSEQYDDAFVSIVVKDTGIGMDKTLISKLFAIEEKVGRPGTAGEPSSGLGLILSKEFITRQNGKLLVESEPCKGSTLTVLLPLANV